MPRSTSAPCRFIATSQVPVPRPTRNSPAATIAITGSAVPSPATTNPVPSTATRISTARAAPIRPASQPDVGSDITAPMLMASSSNPSWDGLSPSRSRTSGIRLASPANAIPAAMNAAITPACARRARGSGSGSPMRAGPRRAPARSRRASLPG